MNHQARIDQITAELTETRKQLAAVEALICQCRPEPRQAGHPHATDCPVTAQTATHAQNGAST